VSQSLSGSLEELVLTSLVWDTETASKIIMYGVTPDLFTTRHFTLIAKATIDHILRYSESPKNHLPDILEQELNKGESSAIIWKQIERMGEMYPDIQVGYVSGEIDTFIKKHKMRRAIAAASELIQKDDIIKAQEALYSFDYDTKPDQGSSIWLNEPDQALSFLDHDREEDQFSLGIEALDVRGIRPRRKELFIIMAPKKRGKSTALVQVGCENAFVNRKKVLHITLEMSAEETSKRYVQCLCGMTQKEVDELRVPIFKRDTNGNYVGTEVEQIKPMTLNRQNRKVAAEKLQTISRGQKRLLIKEFPTSTLTTAHLIMFLDQLKRTENFEPDLLIVDYANLMHINYNQLRVETGRIFRELRGISMSRNMAVVTATQGNRSSEDAKVVGSTHVSEDWSVMGTADIIITICRTPEEKTRNLARLYVAAARGAPDQYMVQISQSYETCSFALDSIYMNKLADRDFSRMMEGDDDD
jgi:hypothetical protein